MDSETTINAITNAPQFAALRKEIAQLSSRKMLVLEQCGLTETRRGRVEAEMKSNAATYQFIDPSERLGLSKLYIDMASVSFGDVPQFLEYAAMPPADLSAWLGVCVSVNPTMFAWIDELSKAIEQVDAEILKAVEEENAKKK